MPLTSPANSVDAINCHAADVTVQLHNSHAVDARTNHADAEAWLAVISSVEGINIWRLFYVMVLKRTVDLLASAVLLLALFPLLLALVIVIRLDSPGPAIFRQERVGRRGRRFKLYKFRTMVDNPSGRVAWSEDEHGRMRHKLRNDPRVTSIGRWLRRSSLDELPQLVNILKGDMSLIGPRPELPQIVERYALWQHDRHLVRPGLTGWWQVSGRSDLLMHENTELDLFYVRRQSFRLDLLIAMKTIRVVYKGFGAF